MTERQYQRLLTVSGKRYKGNESIFNTLAIFDREDLVHEYIASSNYRKADGEKEEIANFKDFINRMVRDGKRRKNAGLIIRHSNNKMLDNFQDSYRDDDVIDGYCYRNSPLADRVNTSLYEDSYKDIRGNIDYNRMTEDMQKVMCEKDRAMCVHNKENNRAYWIGNPMAIPIEQLYSAGFYITKANRRVGVE